MVLLCIKKYLCNYSIIQSPKYNTESILKIIYKFEVGIDLAKVVLKAILL